MKKNAVDKLFLFLFGIMGILLLSFFFPPVIKNIMSILCGFSSDGDFNINHWTNIITLYALKFLFIDILLFIFFYLKVKEQASLKDSFEVFVAFVNRISRPVQVLLSFSLILFFHSFITLDSFDDLFFKEHIQNESVFSFVGGRYYTWTSRMLIETIMLSSYAVNDGLWRVLDSFAFVVIAEAFVRLAVPEGKRKYSFVAYILLLFVPILCLSSCGWAAVTCNYLWPCAATLCILVIMKNIFNKVRIPKWQYIVSLLLSLYAANQEQLAALLFGLSFVFLAYRLFEGKRSIKDNWYFLLIILITLVSLAFILTCPGNKSRYAGEVANNFPEYPSIGIAKKLVMSIPLVFSYFFGIGMPNIVIIPLLFSLTIIAYKNKNNSMKPLVLIIDLFVIIFGFMGIILSHFIPVFVFQEKHFYPYGGVSLLSSVIEIIVFVLLAVILTIAVYKSSRDKPHGLLNILLMAAGYCSAAIQAFSPTIYEVSWGRMFFFTMIILIYVSFDLFITSMRVEEQKKL